MEVYGRKSDYRIQFQKSDILKNYKVINEEKKLVISKFLNISLFMTVIENLIALL